MSVGERIKEFRKKAGLTQAGLAEKCGMKDSAIRRYESGRGNPTERTLRRIAEALNVSVEDFYKGGFGVGMPLPRNSYSRPLDISLPNNDGLTDDFRKEIERLYDFLVSIVPTLNPGVDQLILEMLRNQISSLVKFAELADWEITAQAPPSSISAKEAFADLIDNKEVDHGLDKEKDS